MKRLGVIVLLLVSIAAPARADVERVGDGSDARGPLDIRWVRQRHDYGKVLYGLATTGNWSDRDLRRGRFIFSFDIDSDPGFERFVIVHWRDWERTEGGHLASPVKNSKREIIGRAGVAHWDGNRLRIWIARRHLEHPTWYRMTVRSEWRDEPCSEVECVDTVRAIDHRLWPLCEGRDPTIVGTPGDDVIRGTRAQDIVIGRGGDDRIEGDGDACGGVGDDVLVGGRYPDHLQGGPGNDVLYGRRARISCSEPPIDGSSGDCPLPTNYLYGGPGDDRIYGGSDHDYLYGGRDYDYLDGREEDDWCYGGEVEQRC